MHTEDDEVCRAFVVLGLTQNEVLSKLSNNLFPTSFPSFSLLSFSFLPHSTAT